MRFTPTVLKELCKKYDLLPSKRYGQNYLIEEWPVKKMIEIAEINKKDTVIEIGPGFGVLTFALAEKVKKVVAFEIEKKLEDYWTEQTETKKLENLEIIFTNALYGLKSYVLSPMSSYKIIANLPYQITSDLLRTIFELKNKPESVTIMVQKEVAERICAKPGEMSLLAVAVQYYGEPQIANIITKGNFWPSPKVDSAILHITLPPNHLNTQSLNHFTTNHTTIVDDKEFFKVVKAGFAQKRKQLWNNLSKGLKIDGQKIKNILNEVTGNEKIRAEELSVQDWHKITNKIIKN